MADSFQSQLPVTPTQVLEIVIRQRWLIIIPLCITLTVGLYNTLTAKKTYQASTLILVQPQRVPTSYVRSVVTSTISQRISTISQQILSQSNLEKIIDQFGLYENSENMYLEDKIAGMRRRVKVKIEKARRGTEAFSIIFKGSNPQTVMKIANTLASYFMDENLKVREAQAVGTSDFLDSELEKTRKRLEDRERQLAEYKNKYLGGLPNELETNLRTLDRLQKQHSIKYEMLREVRSAMKSFENQIAQSKELASQSFGDQFSSFEFDEEAFDGSESNSKIIIVQEQLNSLLFKYTERHPDVQKLKKTIEKLQETAEKEKQTKEAKEANMPDSEKDSKEDTAGNNNQEISMLDFTAMQQDAQRKQLQSEMKKILSDIQGLEQRMEVYQKRVEDTPKRELELQSMQRGYANIQSIFDSLLKRKLEAELSVNMEKKQKGEQFRILDHARLPEKPTSPNVQTLFLFSVAAGFGIGAGIIAILELFDSRIRREEQIETDLNLTILAAIPPIARKNTKLKKRLELSAFACCSAYAVVFFSFFAILNYKGLDRTINLIKSTLNM